MARQPNVVPEWLTLAPEWQTFDDERLGLEFFALWIADQATRAGVKELTPEIADRFRVLTEGMDGESVKSMALEKALVRVARGDAAAGGRIFRSWMLQSAGERATERIAKGAVAEKVRTDRQRKSASKKGVEAKALYSDEQRKKWQEMAASPEYKRLSGRRAAHEIRKALRLDHEAEESIRKTIGGSRPKRVG